MSAWLGRAKKAIGATLSAAVAVLIAANSDGDVTAVEWGAVASAVVVGAITYVLRNRDTVNGSVPPSSTAPGRPPSRGW